MLGIVLAPPVSRQVGLPEYIFLFVELERKGKLTPETLVPRVSPGRGDAESAMPIKAAFKPRFGPWARCENRRFAFR